MVQVNFGNVAKNYARYRNDIPDELIKGLKIRGVDFYQKKVADLGAGTGALTRLLQAEGADVFGVEPSLELIEEAKLIDASITYINGYSDSTNLASDSCDIVTVMRAWHWFDRPATLNEIKRILTKKGKLLVIDSGFIANSRVVINTLEMIKSHMPNGEVISAGSKGQSKQLINSFPVEWFQEWKEHNFDMRETYKFTYQVPFTNEEWCGRVGSLSWLSNFSDEKREQVLAEIYQYLEKEFGDTAHKVEPGCYVTILEHTKA
jgi:ubiquinone/menaquinone biosynthesis C-methylase UbiE